MSDDKKNDAVDFMMELVNRNGVACSTVSHGHVLTFKSSWLKSLLEQHGNKETIVLFIKRPDFKN
jgi:hypothetical protein